MKRLLIGFAVVLMVLSMSWMVLAAPQPKPEVTMGVEAKTSTIMIITPEKPGEGNSNNWVYQYTIHDGGSVSDILPIQVCITAQGDDPWISLNVGLKKQDSPGNLPGTVSASDLTFTPTSNQCQTMNINVSTGVINLSNPNNPEEFNGNLQITDTASEVPVGSKDLKVDWSKADKNVKIKVTVLPAESINISCYMTDSSGYFLNDCSGQPVSESASDDGRFSLVTNNKKGIVVATNPGQFYYNVLYENTTALPQTVKVTLTPSGLSPKGAQAVHAALFPPPFSGVSPDTFNIVNESIPEGSDGTIYNITIPSGWTLWVTYHLEWAGLGMSIPGGLATSCGGASESISVNAVISGTGISTEQCNAGALGYKK